MPTPLRKEIQPGTRVMFIEKYNQCSGQLTEGIVLHQVDSKAWGVRTRN